MSGRNYRREILAARDAKDWETLSDVALELAGMVDTAKEIERRDVARKAAQAERTRASRERAVTLRNVTGNVTSQDVTLQPLVRIKDKEHLSTKNLKASTKATNNNGAPADAGRFSKADCDALYERWSTRRGGIKYPVFRTALLPLYPASGARYELADLLNALDAFAEAAGAAPPEYGNLWTIQKFVADVTRWLRLGKLPLVDEWGEPTERGRAAKIPVSL